MITNVSREKTSRGVRKPKSLIGSGGSIGNNVSAAVTKKSAVKVKFGAAISLNALRNWVKDQDTLKLHAEGVEVKYRIGKDRQMAPRGDYCAYMLKTVSIYVKIVLYTHKQINK